MGCRDLQGIVDFKTYLQRRQVDDPSVLATNDPVHRVQLLPSAEAYPTGQGTPAGGDTRHKRSPSSPLNLSAASSMSSSACPVEVGRHLHTLFVGFGAKPGRHWEHCDAPAIATEPGSHITHMEPLVLAKPGSHSLQAVRAALGEYPRLQASHCADPARVATRGQSQAVHSVPLLAAPVGHDSQADLPELGWVPGRNTRTVRTWMKYWLASVGASL
jgi:hypothetical protein